MNSNKTIMNILIFFIIAFTISACIIKTAFAEGQVVDPTITPTYTITCEYPIEREDGTPLAINEIAKVNFFVSQDKVTWTPAGSNTSACRQVYDLSSIPDGQYYYTGTTVDTEARESIKGSDAIPPLFAAIVVKRIAKPGIFRSFSGLAS